MHAMTAVSSVNQPQNDRKSVVFCKRPARMELFRDAVFCCRSVAAPPTRTKSPFSARILHARGVCPPPNHTSIPYKCTVVHACNVQYMYMTLYTVLASVHNVHVYTHTVYTRLMNLNARTAVPVLLLCCTQLLHQSMYYAYYSE